MPIILKKTTLENVKIGIWKILEEESFFLSRINLSPTEKEQLSTIKGKRRLHWLSSRYLLHLLIDNYTTRLECLKDTFGKPYLKNNNQHISFSHSEDLVAVTICKKPVGVDIQLIVPKISRIAHKFIRDDEIIEMPHLEGLHYIWGAKEAAYKAYGRKKLDFKQNLTWTKHQNHDFSIHLTKNDEKYAYRGKFEKWGKYILVYLKET